MDGVQHGGTKTPITEGPTALVDFHDADLTQFFRRWYAAADGDWPEAAMPDGIDIVAKKARSTVPVCIATMRCWAS